MFDHIVPPITHQLTALSGVLSKAEAHCTARSIDPAAFLTFRLYPDMLNFTRQVQLTCDFAVRGAFRLAGEEPPSIPDTETDFAGLQARIAKARDLVAGFGPDRFAGAETRKITLKLRAGEREFTGLSYLTGYVLPNFYFHATTAYDILRHNGVEIGKPDFLGA